MSHWAIYGLRDSPDHIVSTSEVRYIGKSNDPYVRIKEHCVAALERVIEYEYEWETRVPESNRERQDWPDELDVEPPEPFTWWLAEHWRAGLLPEVVILEVGSGDGWRERERHWIDVATRLGLELYNTTRGG